jgi:hypothetical protein
LYPNAQLVTGEAAKHIAQVVLHTANFALVILAQIDVYFHRYGRVVKLRVENTTKAFTVAKAYTDAQGLPFEVLTR